MSFRDSLERIADLLRMPRLPSVRPRKPPAPEVLPPDWDEWHASGESYDTNGVRVTRGAHPTTGGTRDPRTRIW